MSVALYSYYRSSASYRVRIALNLKKIDYEIRPVHLLQDGGEQRQPDYLAINPQGLVPMLEVDDAFISQSSAIIEYLEEVYPEPPLLPKSAMERAHVRSLAQLIACEIHPLNNLRVLQYLKNNFDFEDAGRSWYGHWVQEGFAAFEQMLKTNGHRGTFCHGDIPGMGDAFLIPQVYNALRFSCDMSPYPLIKGIYRNCIRLSAFKDAAPENQPDVETG